MDATFHESDERLELYALNRLSDSDVVQIEEHLLACDSCRDRLEHNAGFAVAMSDALASNRAAEPSGRPVWFKWLRPRFALAGGLAVVLAAFILSRGRAPVNTVASLQLTATRGSETNTVRPAKELDLTFGYAAPGAQAPVVEVVESGGAVVWKGSPATEAGLVRARIGKVLEPGDYFARFYDSPGHLVHEYAFSVKK